MRRIFRCSFFEGQNFDDEQDERVGDNDNEYYRGNVEQSGNTSLNALYPSGARPPQELPASG